MDDRLPFSRARNDVRTALLLPNYDEYVVGYADRSSICDSVFAKGVDSRANILFNHTIALDGKISGTWRRALSKTRVTIEAKLFTPINSIQARKLAAAAGRYGAFLGLEAELT